MYVCLFSKCLYVILLSEDYKLKLTLVPIHFHLIFYLYLGSQSSRSSGLATPSWNLLAVILKLFVLYPRILLALTQVSDKIFHCLSKSSYMVTMKSDLQKIRTNMQHLKLVIKSCDWLFLE